MRIAVTPREADAPLVINPNAVRPRAITLTLFKLVSRGNAKIVKPSCLMQVQQFPPPSPFNRLKSTDHAVLKERLGISALDRPDQVPVYDVAGIM